MAIYVLGPRGTNGHEAATVLSKALGERIDFCDSNVDILRKVQGDGGYGVVPIENGQAGLVSEVISFWLSSFDRDRRRFPYVVASIEQPIVHCLIVYKGVRTIGEVKEVISHPQAIAQCRDFITRHNLFEQGTTSTAAAVEQIAASRDRSFAAIGSKFAGELHDLPVLFEGIQDSAFNMKRFHIVVRNRSQKVDDVVKATSTEGKAHTADHYSILGSYVV